MFAQKGNYLFPAPSAHDPWISTKITIYQTNKRLSVWISFGYIGSISSMQATITSQSLAEFSLFLLSLLFSDTIFCKGLNYPIHILRPVSLSKQLTNSLNSSNVSTLFKYSMPNISSESEMFFNTLTEIFMNCSSSYFDRYRILNLLWSGLLSLLISHHITHKTWTWFLKGINNSLLSFVSLEMELLTSTHTSEQIPFIKPAVYKLYKFDSHGTCGRVVFTIGYQ